MQLDLAAFCKHTESKAVWLWKKIFYELERNWL
jgi:hypothetical protein